MGALKPIGPTTEGLYQGALKRAFGDALARPPYDIPAGVYGWTEPSKALLRAAMKRRYAEAGMDPEPLLDQLPVEWSVKTLTEIPTEAEAVAYERAAGLLPPGRRALALLPLAMGLRAREVITLPRRAVERAVEGGELLVLRKGAKEQLLPAQHARKLLETLLKVKAARLVRLFEPVLQEGRTWKTVGEVLSTGEIEAQYVALHELVRKTGVMAGIKDLRPHKLRHAFATRMARDGAPLPVIQWTLGHSNVSTTMKYVHPGAQDAQKYVRSF